MPWLVVVARPFTGSSMAAIPKSKTLTSSLPSSFRHNIRFSSLMSRCTIPLWCTNSKAAATWARSWTTSGSGSWPRSSSRCPKFLPCRRSITR